MNLSGIRIQAGFYDYNSITGRQTTEQRRTEELSAQEQAAELSVRQAQEPSAQEQAAELSARQEGKSRPDTGAADYASRYQPEAVYEMKGVDSDIARLDVEKAISDMRRDQILERYQFFVGTGNSGRADGRVDEEFFL